MQSLNIHEPIVHAWDEHTTGHLPLPSSIQQQQNPKLLRKDAFIDGWSKCNGMRTIIEWNEFLCVSEETTFKNAFELHR